MTILSLLIGFVGGIGFMLLLAWFTRDDFPTLFVPRDWDSPPWDGK
jgi:hypothetical protein